jgi:hypothetical protein
MRVLSGEMKDLETQSIMTQAGERLRQARRSSRGARLAR